MMTDLQWEFWAEEKRKEKANHMRKTIPDEETTSIASRKANDHMEKHAHSSMTRTRKAKERHALAHFFWQLHHTETRKVTEKVARTKVLKAHTHTILLVTVRKSDKLPCTSFKKRSCQRRNSRNYWQVPDCTKVTAPGGCITFHRVLNDRKIQSDSNTQYRVKLHHLANKYVLKRQKLGPTHGAIQTRPQNQRNPNALTFEERSIEGDEIATEKQLRFYTNTVCWVPGSYSENRHKFFKPNPASSVSSPWKATSEAGEFIVDLGALLHTMSKKNDLQQSRKRFGSRRIHQFLWLHMERLVRLKKRQ